MFPYAVETCADVSVLKILSSSDKACASWRPTSASASALVLSFLFSLSPIVKQMLFMILRCHDFCVRNVVKLA